MYEKRVMFAQNSSVLLKVSFELYTKERNYCMCTAQKLAPTTKARA